MKKTLTLIMLLVISPIVYGGGACSSCCGEKNEFERQTTRQIAPVVRSDTARLKVLMNSTSSKARRIKKRASIEFFKPKRANSREELEKERKEQAALANERQLKLLAERLAERQRKRAFEKTRKSSDLKEEKTDNKEESKSNKSLVLEDLQ